MTTNQAIENAPGWIGVRRPHLESIPGGRSSRPKPVGPFELNRVLADRSGLAQAVHATHRPTIRYTVGKRTFDVSVALMLLTLTLPVWVALAAIIKLHDGGPVLFRQERTGRGGQRFKMLKFRSMHPNAEQMKAELRHLSTVAWPDFKLDNDPRITPVGRFMRATYLDEIPQLLNVLRGEMSLVGPRPTSFAPSTYSVWHTERLDATPGITGLWQVKRSNEETSFDERLRLDVHYIRNRSILGDLGILFGTVTRSLRRSGR